MVAEDGSLVIARVRLPRHPDTLPTVSEEDEFYAIACEVSTMRFVRHNLPSVVVPEVYAYEGPGSRLATAAGAIYMLLEGFYGNTLQDIAPDLCSLPIQVASQEHVMAQWTMAQTQLATLAYTQIGSINSITESGEPVIGKLSTAAAEGLIPQGLFSTATEYFIAIGRAAFRKAKLLDEERNQNSSHFSISRLGALTTGLFKASQAYYPLNRMDLGTQNIIVDDDFNFLGLIDWEFAQAAPWQVNHYPMLFPPLWPDAKIKKALDNPRETNNRNSMWL
ncbi:Protein kinase-like domain protein [Tolypocladium paradoxum]|uniref:Protein kinase-like domain protein n=1 Tax=Tolypocladium paradoxum TaxID=94208 RepID=A0A2S4L9H3_9HYPO|nr:Protein kinase-like domain protein [Tolypocladium paradoxum]